MPIKKLFIYSKVNSFLKKNFLFPFLRGIPFVIKVKPGKFKGHFKYLTQNGKDLIATSLWRHGWTGFEKPLPDIFAEITASIQDGLVLDVGANTGLYSLIAITVNKHIEVHAFEPFPPVEKILRKNIDLNSDDRISVFPQAVSDQTGSAKLYVPLQDHGVVESSCSLNCEFKEAHSEVLDVEQTTLDEHMNKYPDKKVKLIKIDVEGFEDHVLRGGFATISIHRPIIILEVLHKIDANTLESIRRRLQYDSFRFNRSGRLIPDEIIGFDPESWNHIMLPSELGVPTEIEYYF